MPWCITCGEVENPEGKELNGIIHHPHKYISWKEYLQHKLLKKYKGHESYW